MSVMNKPDYKIFAQDAKSGEYVAFPDILRGWGITLDQYNGFPPMELFNSAAKRIDEWLMYLTQRGLPEWDAAVDYPKDAMIQHAGVYYVSLKVTKGEQPNNSQASWKKLTEFLGVDKKLDKDSVLQTTGTSTTNVMSQKAVTDLANTKADLNSASEQSFNGVVSTKKEIAVRTGNRRTLVQAGGLITFSIDNVTWYVATFQNKTGTVAYTSDLSILADKDAKEDQVFNSKISAKEFNAADGNNRNILKASGMITHSSDLSTWYDFMLPKRTGTAALTLDAIGSGAHIWYDMTAQRKLDVVYNNTAGKPIEVSIYCKSVHVYINSIRVAAAPVGNRCNISLIVPAGGSISVTSQENSGELVWWSELR